jgi:hypothetical protein
VDGDITLSFPSNISPPVFIQPLPDILPVFSGDQASVNFLPRPSLPSF